MLSLILKNRMDGDFKFDMVFYSTLYGTHKLFCTFCFMISCRFYHFLAGDAYEDAVRRLAYFRHLVSGCSCQCCYFH